MESKLFFAHPAHYDANAVKMLQDFGYTVILTTDPHGIVQGVPMTPIALPADIVTQCLYKAVNSRKETREAFGNYMLEEMGKIHPTTAKDE